MIQTPTYEKMYKEYETTGSISYENFSKRRRNAFTLGIFITIYCLAGGCLPEGLWVGGNSLRIQYGEVVLVSVVLIFLYFYFRFDQAKLPYDFFFNQSNKFIWSKIKHDERIMPILMDMLKEHMNNTSGDANMRNIIQQVGEVQKATFDIERGVLSSQDNKLSLKINVKHIEGTFGGYGSGISISSVSYSDLLKKIVRPGYWSLLYRSDALLELGVPNLVFWLTTFSIFVRLVFIPQCPEIT